MLKTERMKAVFAQLGLECPAAAATKVGDPSGQPPSMSDTVTLHIPLPMDSDVRDEVEDSLCPGLSLHEQRLDNSEDKKPGSEAFIVSRKNWGTYNATFWIEGVEKPVLKMAESRLKGKPEVLFFKEVDPVLSVTLRGSLTDGVGETSDQIRRRYVHSQVFVTLAVAQTAMTDDEAGELDDAAAEPQEAPRVVPAAEPPVASGMVAGSTAVGPRPDALPEHDFTSEYTKRTAQEMEKVHPGFVWSAIQERQRMKPGSVCILGWAELTSAAAKAQDVQGMKEIRARVEAGG